MSRHYIVLIGIVIFIVVVVILDNVFRVNGQTRGGVNNYFSIDTLTMVWFPYRYDVKDKSDYVRHVGDYYELLVYVDSMNCTTCQVRHLYKWQLVAEHVEKEIGKAIMPIVVLSPRKDDLLSLQFEYNKSMPTIPVILMDNHLSDDNLWLKKFKKMSVFLLDQNRKVVRIYKL